MLFRTLPRHCSVVLRQVLVSLFENCPQCLPSAYFSEPCLLPILKQSFPPCCFSVPPPSTEPWPMRHHPILLSAASSSSHRPLRRQQRRFVRSCLHTLITITEHSNRISASNNYSQTRHCRATALPLRLPIASCWLLRLAADG